MLEICSFFAEPSFEQHPPPEGAGEAKIELSGTASTAQKLNACELTVQVKQMT